MARWPAPADLAAAAPGRRRPGLGPARLPAPGPAPARRRGRDRAATTTAGCPTTVRRAAGPAGRRRLHRRRGGQLRLRPAARRPRHQRAPGAGPGRERARPAGARPDARRAPTGRRGCCRTDDATAAAWNVAVMELGALVCTARSPRCGDCPRRGPVRVAAGRPRRRTTGRRAAARPGTAPTGRCAARCSPCCAQPTDPSRRQLAAGRRRGSATPASASAASTAWSPTAWSSRWRAGRFRLPGHEHPSAASPTGQDERHGTEATGPAGPR